MSAQEERGVGVGWRYQVAPPPGIMARKEQDMNTTTRHLWTLLCVLGFVLMAFRPWWPAWSM